MEREEEEKAEEEERQRQERRRKGQHLLAALLRYDPRPRGSLEILSYMLSIAGMFF